MRNVDAGNLCFSSSVMKQAMVFVLLGLILPQISALVIQNAGKDGYDRDRQVPYGYAPPSYPYGGYGGDGGYGYALPPMANPWAPPMPPPMMAYPQAMAPPMRPPVVRPPVVRPPVVRPPVVPPPVVRPPVVPPPVVRPPVVRPSVVRPSVVYLPTSPPTVPAPSVPPPVARPPPIPGSSSVRTGGFACGDHKSTSSRASGYIVYTYQPVNQRFASDSSATNFMKHKASNLFCVRYGTSQSSWQYDANWGNWAGQAVWRNFVPVPTDVSVAKIDYATGKVSDVSTPSSNLLGLRVGSVYGDLTFYSHSLASNGVVIGGTSWFASGAGNSYSGPIWITARGSYILPTQSSPPRMVMPQSSVAVKTGDINCGAENRKAEYVMYTKLPVTQRFSTDTTPAHFVGHTAVNLVCVRLYKGHTWQYDANWGDWAKQAIWRNFVPVSTDVLVARLGSSRKVLSGTNKAFNGIQMGYLYGDLQLGNLHLFPRSVDATEKTRITGSYFLRFPTSKSVVPVLGPVPAGAFIAKTGDLTCGNAKSGRGFIMYTQQPVDRRFASDAPDHFVKHAAKNFVCIRFAKARWQYDANWGNWAQQPVWRDFAPSVNDVAVATVLFRTGAFRDLKGKTRYFNGLRIGYSYGDLTFAKSRSAYAPLHFLPTTTMTIAGSYIMIRPASSTVSSVPPPRAIKTMPVRTGQFSCGDSKSGHGIMMYSRLPVNVRFRTDTSPFNFFKHRAKNLVCVRYIKNHWQYDANWGNWARKPIWRPFIPSSTDVGVAIMDYANTIVNLRGVNKRFRGLQLGYLHGDLKFPRSFSASWTSAHQVYVTGSYVMFYPTPGSMPTTWAMTRNPTYRVAYR
eukprot:TRINITY_DN8496_c0_g1_i1.p1 TRINITY_DN8496_c0_g1~~TRINITY_DN8496_c0_g1_i1.p1  ORF type:complete len:847 (+),score=93.65 TRINITY_DN8496_c0_g1_i1:65-2605(+)